MSKIYEALLRAELERTAIPGEPEEEPASPLDGTLLTQASDRPRTPDFSAPPTAGNSGNERYDVLHLPTVTASDLETLAARPWLPLFTSLPAIGEGGPEVEQFRSLRSHIIEFREQKPIKTILISSGLPGEGKSYVAANLAVSFARHRGNQVLLIDGDMRRGSLHKLLGTPSEPGLTEYLSGKVPLQDIMQRPQAPKSSPLPPGLASLTFIPSGTDAEMAGDLAANARFVQLVETVAPLFDWVIVDSSPVNLVSDAVSLAHACDGVLLVGREGVTKYKTAQLAQNQFKSANVLGFILNAVRKPPAKDDYYGTYNSYKAEA